MSDLVFTVDVDTASGIKAINTFFDTVENGSKAAGEKLRKALGDEEIEKEVIITLKNGKAVAQEVNKISSDTDRIVKAQKALNGEYGRTQTEVGASLELLKQLKGTTEKYSKDNKTITSDWKLINTRIQDADKLMKDLNGTSTTFGGKIREIFDGLVGKITAANLASNALTGTMRLLGGAIQFLFKEGLQFEQLNLQLEAFTGSAQGARMAMDSFLKTAIQTPLDVKQVASAGKTLMAFGLEANTAKDAVHNLAIIAGATGGQMDNLARNLGQIAAQGRAFTRDLNQFAVQGIPIYSQLAEVMGVSVTEVRRMAEAGQVGFPEVQSAIANMTREGSAFAEIASKMNDTFTGRIEEMISSVQMLAGEVTAAAMELDKFVGSPVTGAMSAASAIMKTMADNMDNIVIALKAAVVATGTWLAILAAGNIGAVVAGLQAFLGVVVATTTKIWGLVAALIAKYALLGPAGWIALTGAVVAFGVALTQMKGSQEASITNMRELGDSVEELTDEKMDPTKPTNWGQAIGELRGTVDKNKESVDALTKKQDAYNKVGKDTTQVTKDLKQAKDDLATSQNQLKAAFEGDYANSEVGKIQQLILAKQDLIGEMENELNKKGGLIEQQNAAKQAYDDEIKKNQELQTAVADFFDNKIKGQQRVLDDLQGKIDQEKQLYSDAKDAAQARWDEEIRAIDNRNNAIIGAINDEISALRGKTPEERALEAFRIRELKQRRAAAGLSVQEKLELDAQISRKERQEQIDQAQERLAQAKVKAERERKKALEDQKKEMDELKKRHDQQIKDMGSLVKEQRELIKATKDEKEARIEALKEVVKGAEDQIKTLGDVDDAIEQNIKNIIEAKRSYDDATKAIQSMQRQIQRTARDVQNLRLQLSRAQTAANNLARSNPNRMLGGSVSGGQSYTVNEAGKEAFLSASGKLSMINAPAWGTWKAPGAGTVIPAHLTSQLNIPGGGIDLNQSAAANTNTAGGGGLRSVSAAISALAQSQGNITNNVTIQAANTTQAASDMLVDLSRLKRRR